MAGHSKWSKIKRKKGANDTARSKVFSRLVKEITVAAREGGGDPTGNARLRTAIDAAKADNLPANNIDKAIKRGTGEIPGVVYEEVTFEGYGPGGVAILVQATTDNRRRTVPEMRKIFEKAGGNMGEPGSVAWMFKQAGLFVVDASTIEEDDLLMVALDAGADDVSTQGDVYEILAPPNEFHVVSQALDAASVELMSRDLAMLPQSTIGLEGREAERCIRLMESLDDHDDVQNVWTNADISEEVAEQAAAG
ncbi:MAG: YebC/PmpR family DNA-binding transcriptional regulator [Acidobacteria bacterium]|nr:YebC/PmpR family DNA-binding transcriptional regulator [Acidobacteriota bacterium]